MSIIDLPTYRRQRDLVRAGAHVFNPPAEHPATTLRRDADAARVPLRTRYPSRWYCRTCDEPNLIDDSTCRRCGRDRSAPRDPR